MFETMMLTKKLCWICDHRIQATKLHGREWPLHPHFTCGGLVVIGVEIGMDTDVIVWTVHQRHVPFFSNPISQIRLVFLCLFAEFLVVYWVNLICTTIQYQECYCRCFRSSDDPVATVETIRFSLVLFTTSPNVSRCVHTSQYWVLWVYQVLFICTTCIVSTLRIYCRSQLWLAFYLNMMLVFWF